MKNRKDLLFFLIWPMCASAISISIKANPLMADILFMIIPSIFISVLNPRSIVKSAIFSFLTVPILLYLDYASNINGQWVDNLTTSFSFKFYHVVAPEVLIWGFLLSFLTIMMYEYFLDRNKKKDKALFMHKLIYLAWAFTLIPTFLMTIVLDNPLYNYVPYFYLIWGTIGILLPVLLTLIRFKRLRLKFILIGIYFFYFTLTQELTALYMKWWYFPQTSKFLGWVSIFGLKFPYEELFFWLVLCAMANISWYEYFDDDTK